MAGVAERKAADLYITDRCSFNCRHCFLGSELNSGQQMSVGMVNSIAAYLNNAGFSEVTLLGGEPFQHPEIVEIAHEVEAVGLSCRIVTNGYRQAGKVLGSGRLPREVELTFSVDGGNSEVHDGIRRRGSYSQLAESSRLAVEMGYSTSAILSVSTQNAKDIGRILAACERDGFKRLTIHHVTARGNASNMSVLGESDWVAVLDAVSKFSRTATMQIRCEDPFFTLQPDAPLRCAVQGETNLMFFPDGRVYSCLLFIGSEGGNGAFWNGQEVVQISPSRGDRAACLRVSEKSTCPASVVVRPDLYPGVRPSRIRCIYDKVALGRGR